MQCIILDGIVNHYYTIKLIHPYTILPSHDIATDLYHVVTSLADLQPQWEELAVSLGVPIEEIATHHSIVCRCLYETIRYWITRIGGSWEGLEEALNSERVQRHDTAEIIRRDYITGNAHINQYDLNILVYCV